LRRGARKGIHDLKFRYWQDVNEEEAANSWFFMWPYLDELPVALQAFVLYEDDGRFFQTANGMAPRFDPNHLQPYDNVGLPRQNETKLHDLVLRAKERIACEIRIVQDLVQRSRQPRETLLEKSRPKIAGLLIDFQVREATYREVGPLRLLVRARQRFFFILAAEEILNALTSNDAQNELDTTWYVEESSAGIRGHLFVQDDKVHLYPPVLFDFVVGVQVSRIRKCEICGNYFWAGRKDKKMCTEKCGAIKRKREERKRYREIKLGDRAPVKRTKTVLRLKVGAGKSRPKNRIDKKG